LLRLITSPGNTQISNSIQTTSVQKKLLRDHRRFGTWRAVAAHYGVNVRYIHDLAVHGVDPVNPAVRAALGLHRLKPPILVDTRPPWLRQAVQILKDLEKRQRGL